MGFLKTTFSQEFNKNIDKDSLFTVILKDIPEEKRNEFKKIYEEGNEESKEFLLFMFSMPRSSKKELVDNYENKSKEITILKNEYSKLVPDSLIVSIEFNPENKIVNTTESIDLKIYRKNPNGRSTVIAQEWNLDRESEKLAEMLLTIGWNKNSLNKIKELLDSANCVSIENGRTVTIGFARSGMGKYFYKVFDKNLTDNEIEEYNDGCTYIYHKDNIVLEYGGGAVGPQCFPDE
ncbi:hypothetical protein DDT91_11015 [Algoriphagus sp. AK58]|nr:hypothetical protein [Algoriphagus sp. AK58]